MAFDILYPVRPGEDNEELRWSLRTLEANFPHRRVWIVGHKPSWVSDEVGFIEGNLWGNAQMNVYNNIRIACEDDRLSARVGIWNDDFFVTEPMKTIKTEYRSTLREHIETRRVQLQQEQWWPVSLRTTLLALQAHGFDDPLSYELHTPFVVNRKKMADTLNLFRYVTPEAPPQWRTLYGNMNKMGGKRREADVKVYADGEIKKPFHSTIDRAFPLYAKRFAKAYPRPSKYERV